MSTKAAAAYLGLSYYYLRNLRHQMHQHDGPKYRMRCRKEVMKGKGNKGVIAWYEVEDLNAWKASHKFRK